MKKIKFSESRGTVLFVLDSNNNWKAEYWLTGVKRNKDDSIKSGWVENGCWNYERRKNEELAKQGNSIVNRWEIREYKEVPVTYNWVEVKDRGEYNSLTGKYEWTDYNAVMRRAQAIMDNDLTYEFKFKSKEELIRIKQRQKELEEMFDDDIAF